MISYRIGDALVSIKAPKEYRLRSTTCVHAAVPAAICHLFDKASGKLLWAGNIQQKWRNADAGRRARPGTGRDS